MTRATFQRLLHAGNLVPKRIVVGGWGLGGALATSFAPWSGMHVPTATVHCIT